MSVAEQTTAFWGAVAQIVPVLALAITLESRVLARRFSRKKLNVARRTRIAMTIWMVATWVLLFVAFGGALGGLTPEPVASPSEADRTGSGSTIPLVYVAQLALFNGVVFAAYVPAMQVVAPGLHMIARSMVLSLPWSSVRRLSREIITLTTENASESAELRAVRREAMLGASRSLVLQGEITRVTRDVRERLDEAPTTEDRRHAAEWLRSTEAKLHDLELNYRTKAWPAITKLDTLIMQNQAAAQSLEEAREMLDSVRDSTDPDVEKKIRKLYANAGRE